jgi:hypothetical protein
MIKEPVFSERLTGNSGSSSAKTGTFSLTARERRVTPFRYTGLSVSLSCESYSIPPEPPLPVLSMAMPPGAVRVLASLVDTGTPEPLTFFIWFRT